MYTKIKNGNTLQKQNLMTETIAKTLPPMRAQDGKGDDAIVHVKFFAPWNQWTWYLLEYDPETGIAFGLVHGDETELGDFSLLEMANITGMAGLGIERDIHWEKKTLGEVKKRLAEKGHC